LSLSRKENRYHKGHAEKQHLQPQRTQRNAEEIRKSKAKVEDGKSFGCTSGQALRKTPEATKKNFPLMRWDQQFRSPALAYRESAFVISQFF